MAQSIHNRSNVQELTVAHEGKGGALPVRENVGSGPQITPNTVHDFGVDDFPFTFPEDARTESLRWLTPFCDVLDEGPVFKYLQRPAIQRQINKMLKAGFPGVEPMCSMDVCDLYNIEYSEEVLKPRIFIVVKQTVVPEPDVHPLVWAKAIKGIESFIESGTKTQVVVQVHVDTTALEGWMMSRFPRRSLPGHPSSADMVRVYYAIGPENLDLRTLMNTDVQQDHEISQGVVRQLVHVFRTVKMATMLIVTDSIPPGENFAESPFLLLLVTPWSHHPLWHEFSANVKTYFQRAGYPVRIHIMQDMRFITWGEWQERYWGEGVREPRDRRRMRQVPLKPGRAATTQENRRQDA